MVEISTNLISITDYVATMGKWYLGALGYYHAFHGSRFKDFSNRNGSGHRDFGFLGSSSEKCINGPNGIKKLKTFHKKVFNFLIPKLFLYKKSVVTAAMPDNAIMTMVTHIKNVDVIPLLYLPMTFLSRLMRTIKNNIIGATSPFATAA